MAFGLVIFDCDGVLIDSEPIANRVLAERLAAIGLSISSDEVMLKFIGRSRADCLERIAELLGRELPGGFEGDWDAALYAAFEKELEAVEGVAGLLQGLALPYCVASNSSRERMRVSLRASGLLPLFEGRMFSGAEVAKAKPAPDVFLLAASTLGIPPSRCAVIEDTPTGVKAAVAAGMTAFGYAGGSHATAPGLKAEGARIFHAMRDLAPLLV